MKSLRFSMAGLMGFVFLLAICFAALKSATRVWAELIPALLLGLLLFAILGIVYARSELRRFWTGFALFGWSSLLFISAPAVGSHLGITLPTYHLLWYLHSQIARAEEPTPNSETISIWIRGDGRLWVDGEEAEDERGLTELLEKAVSKRSPAAVIFFSDDHAVDDQSRRQASASRIVEGLGLNVSSYANTRTRPDWGYFNQVGQSFVTLLAAVIGGSLGWFFFRPKEKVLPQS